GLVAEPPQPAKIRFERGVDRIWTGHRGHLQHHLALAVDHANRALVRADIQSTEVVDRTPPALLRRRTVRVIHPPSDLLCCRKSRRRPITGGTPALRPFANWPTVLLLPRLSRQRITELISAYRPTRTSGEVRCCAALRGTVDLIRA